MALQVSLLKTPGKIPGAGPSQSVHTFDSQGGTLGRGESNTWTLPDPDRFLSSCHCEILFADNQYYIVDLSTNGTFVNGSPEPLGKGVKAPLRDGDTFEIGDYSFAVKSTAADEMSNSSPFAPFAGEAPVNDMSGLAGNSPFADPFGASAAPLAEDLALSPDVENADPLFALDLAAQSGRPRPDDGALFSSEPGQTPDDAYLGMGQVDQTPSMDQAVSWPNSSQENLIPDDWADDLLGPTPSAETTAEASPVPAGTPFEPQQPLSAAPVFPTDLPAGHGADYPHPQQAEPEQPSPRQPSPSPQRPQRTAGHAPRANPDPLLNERAPQKPMGGEPNRSRKPAPGKVRREVERAAGDGPAARGAASGPADRRFVAAMGLDPEALSDEQINTISEMSGTLMREIVEGMMQVLRSRTSIKNEFRMNVTTIEPFENNPLKFSVGVDEALENMFLKESKAYKKPIDAFREGFQEIGEHQLAMIAGIRLGFERMMERFNPEVLEQNFNKQGKRSAIPGVQKAKNWNAYSDYYKGFSDNMESSFQHLFGSDFVQAYEDQLRQLSASRKKKV